MVWAAAWNSDANFRAGLPSRKCLIDSGGNTLFALFGATKKLGDLICDGKQSRIVRGTSLRVGIASQGTANRRVGDPLRVRIAEGEGVAGAGRLAAARAAGGGGEFVDAVSIAIDDPDVADIRGVDGDAGGGTAAAGNGPGAEKGAGEGVFEDLVGSGVVEDPNARAVSHQVGGVFIATVKAEGAGGGLAAGEAAGSTGEAIDLVAFRINDPHVVAVAGDARPDYGVRFFRKNQEQSGPP